MGSIFSSIKSKVQIIDSLSDFVRFGHTCTYLHSILTICNKKHSNRYHNRINKYWHDECKHLCTNVQSAHNFSTDNWHQLYVLLKSYFTFQSKQTYFGKGMYIPGWGFDIIGYHYVILTICYCLKCLQAT